MTSEITITVAIHPEGAVVSGAAEVVRASDGGPAPLPLDQLRVGALEAAPAPVAAAELIAMGAGLGGPTTPMPIRSLLAAASAGPPTPLDLAQLVSAASARLTPRPAWRNRRRRRAGADAARPATGRRRRGP